MSLDIAGTLAVGLLGVAIGLICSFWLAAAWDLDTPEKRIKEYRILVAVFLGSNSGLGVLQAIAGKYQVVLGPHDWVAFLLASCGSFVLLVPVLWLTRVREQR